MTLKFARPSPARRSHRPPRSDRLAPSTAVDVLICGSEDRGDDAAGIIVARQLIGRLADDVRLELVGQLEIDDLLAVPAGARVVIVDAATGIEPGEVIDLDMNALVARADGFRPRSSHALEFREVVGLAELIRGRALVGRVVAVGALRFGLGRPLSRQVRAALPSLAAAVVQAVDRLRVAAARSAPEG